jgi:hypothetical protein
MSLTFDHDSRAGRRYDAERNQHYLGSKDLTHLQVVVKKALEITIRL